MKKRWIGIACIVAIGFSIFGWNPFAVHRDTSGILEDGYTGFETGVERQANGVYVVRALTRMPDVKAEMVRWCFTDRLQTTEDYKLWHPTAHLWMEWEDNKKPGMLIGAADLVHETLGPDPTIHKLRIQFVEPTDFLPDWEEGPGKVAICARAGAIEEPMNFSGLCHIVRDTEFGAEMRSVFWMGHVSKRAKVSGSNEDIWSLEAMAGNTWLARNVLIDEEMATNLMTHAIEEMGILADILPELHAQDNAAEEAGPADTDPTLPENTEA